MADRPWHEIVTPCKHMTTCEECIALAKQGEHDPKNTNTYGDKSKCDPGNRWHGRCRNHGLNDEMRCIVYYWACTPYPDLPDHMKQFCNKPPKCWECREPDDG